MRTFLTRRTFGLALLAGAGGLVVWRQTRPTYEGEALSVMEAHGEAVAGRIVLVDIRRPDEWSLTGIGEGAQPLDMRRKDFESALAELLTDRAAPVALICARGVRSARMATRMTAAGFSRVIDVPEGMLGSSAGPGWLAAGLPVRPYTGSPG
ncbi:MAG: rhodanese-like domain-containing protein [Pseudooceanicola sp.]|nr:rhodanese-like domain-containing protein [Pseudooceanicola sp.]